MDFGWWRWTPTQFVGISLVGSGYDVGNGKLEGEQTAPAISGNSYFMNFSAGLGIKWTDFFRGEQEN